MQFSHTLVALYAVALAGFAAAQSTMTVNTPASVVQCQPVQLSWSGGTAPYFPSIIPGQQPGAAALKEFPSQQGTSLTWTVDLIANTYITIQVRDSTGSLQYSSAVSIQNSSDASCLNGGTSATGAPGASTPAASTPAGSTPAASSAAPTGTSPAASSSRSASRSASSTAASASSSPNSASAVTKTSFGVAALAGLIGAALF